MRRAIHILALGAVLTAAACGSAGQSPIGAPSLGPSASASATASTTPDQSASASPAPGNTVWLCKPGMPDNPCQSNLDTTVVSASGASRAEKVPATADQPIDCFYVYPTVSRQTTTNANLTIDKEERAVAVAQAAMFSQVCRVYAPVYPQLTLAAIAQPSKITLASALVAYGGVYSAFEDYLAHYNDGRGVVFIGHSQGAMLLTYLLKSVVDPVPATRRLMVSALLLGGNVAVPIGKTVGGDFSNIPPCTSATQIGCVVAYSSFDKTPPADSVFGRVGTAINPIAGKAPASLQILCVNPASPGGGTAALQPYFPTGDSSTFTGEALPAIKASTPFVTYPNQYAAHCMSSGGATWLQVDHTGGKSDVRPLVSAVEGATWGLHLIDLNIALGNLVQLAGSESIAFRGVTNSHAREMTP